MVYEQLQVFVKTLATLKIKNKKRSSKITHNVLCTVIFKQKLCRQVTKSWTLWCKLWLTRCHEALLSLAALALSAKVDTTSAKISRVSRDLTASAFKDKRLVPLASFLSHVESAWAAQASGKSRAKHNIVLRRFGSYYSIQSPWATDVSALWNDIRRVTYTRPVLHQHVGQSFPGRAIQADGLPPPFILQIFWKGKQTTNPHYNKVLCHANPPKKYDTSYNRVETG